MIGGLAWALGWATAIAQTALPNPAGIIPALTPDTLQQATACGRSGAACAVAPYQLCPSSDGRYDARVATPFSRVASAAFESAKSGRSGRQIAPGDVNRWGVGIYVFPADSSPHAEAISRLEIRRGSAVVRPTTSTVGPIAAKMPDGSTRQLARGFFSFAPGAFAPDKDVVVAFISASGETTCTLDHERLMALR
jgi:hypothetical protein